MPKRHSRGKIQAIWSLHDTPNFPLKEIPGDQIYIIPAPEVYPWVLTSFDEKQKTSVLLVFIVILLITTIIKQPMKYININNTNVDIWNTNSSTKKRHLLFTKY